MSSKIEGTHKLIVKPSSLCISKKQMRDYRIALGKKQSEFGELLGFCNRTIGNFERGVTPIPLSVSIAIRYLAARTYSDGIETMYTIKGR